MPWWLICNHQPVVRLWRESPCRRQSQPPIPHIWLPKLQTWATSWAHIPPTPTQYWGKTKAHNAMGYLLLRWTQCSRLLQPAIGDAGQIKSSIELGHVSLPGYKDFLGALSTGRPRDRGHLNLHSVRFHQFSTVEDKILCILPCPVHKEWRPIHVLLP